MSLFDPKIASDSLSPSLHFLGIQTAQALSIQGSVLVVGKMLGAVDVAVFSTLRMIINVIKQLLGLLSQSAWPEFIRLNAKEDYARLFTLLKYFWHLTLICLIGLALGLDIGGQSLFEFWLHGRLVYDANCMHLFMIYMLLTMAWLIPAQILMALNTHLSLARWQLLSAIATVLACVVGAKIGGLPGVVIGLILFEAFFMDILVLFLLHHQRWCFQRKFLVIESLLILSIMVISMVWGRVYNIAALFMIAWLLWCIKKGYKNDQNG